MADNDDMQDKNASTAVDNEQTEGDAEEQSPQSKTCQLSYKSCAAVGTPKLTMTRYSIRSQSHPTARTFRDDYSCKNP